MSYRLRTLLAALIVTCSALTVFAIDGVVLIDQNRALAGDVTPGDAPGFPVTISQPGSYKLSSNLAVPANTDGIVIAADHVTLDLNGFRVAGGGSGRGIFNGAIGRLGLAIRNGTITGFLDGIDVGAEGNRTASTEVQQVRAIDNVEHGILVGNNTIVTGNTAVRNGVGGIQTGENVIVNGNTVSLSAIGITVGIGSTVNGNTVTQTQNAIVFQCPSVFIGNVLTNNGTNLFQIADGTCSFFNHEPATP
jgi:hypothetical protein